MSLGHIFAKKFAKNLRIMIPWRTPDTTKQAVRTRLYVRMFRLTYMRINFTIRQN